ncbi:uncharacterized protein BDW43DRAFT_310128 [Aspergillus alliaceus]|uniref:uncharacterized protein n=1 Tax=Petromyces alliaceus TaxID=209559 RepID=UPI0012A6A983|nr:uncharacterized protein BDW43DRAFT_310128 [Aspergillus alliaceus]KAB8234461.1 hypothetical protein BDW43DRAFT_310128 [Aspergillus alliaceus]
MDDGFLVVTLGFLLLSITIMYREVIVCMYLVNALQMGVKEMDPPPDWEDISHQYYVWRSIHLTTTWCASSADNLSSLPFFGELSDRIWPGRSTGGVYTVAVLTYVVTFISSTVLISSIRENESHHFFPQKSELLMMNSSLIIESIVLMSQDTLGALLILMITVCVIWKIQVRWSHNVILMCSLCLTVLMVALSIVRVSTRFCREQSFHMAVNRDQET